MYPFIFSLAKAARQLLRFFMALILIWAYGCGDDADVVVVDFSQAVAVERPKEEASDDPSLKVAVGAMISPKETFIYYHQLLDYIGRRLEQEVQLIQRKTYGEINELFGKGQIDLGFICSGPYVSGKEKYGFELLATPQVRGSHFYQSYLIVNKDSAFHRFEDLRKGVFAFTDPDSNTGKLVPTYWLLQMEEDPESFFDRIIYTYSHDNSIMAVARALVDGAAVDGLIWEYYQNKDPVFTSETRIIRKSESYGIPPVVASRSLPSELRDRIRRVLFEMHQDPEGKRLLDELMINRFVEPREEWYDSIRRMKEKLGSVGKRVHGSEKS